jgi:hypothetical protein
LRTYLQATDPHVLNRTSMDRAVALVRPTPHHIHRSGALCSVR